MRPGFALCVRVDRGPDTIWLHSFAAGQICYNACPHLPNPALFDAGSCFGNAGLGSVLSAIWAPILPAWPRWPLVDPDMLPAQVNPGKSRQIVAKETGTRVRWIRQDQLTALFPRVGC